MKPQLRRSSRLKPIPIKSQESIPTWKNTNLRPINPVRREETPMPRIKRKSGPISRPRPRWTSRPAPPEAYLIIRAHRRPASGWGEVWNWSKKRDEWIYELSSNDSGSGSAGTILIKLEVRDQDGPIPTDNHILNTRLCKLILQYRITERVTLMTSSSTLTPRVRTYTGIQVAQSLVVDGTRIHGFQVPFVPDERWIEGQLFDLGSICSGTGGKATCLATWSMSTTAVPPDGDDSS